MSKPRKREIEIVNRFFDLIYSDTKMSQRLKSEVNATLYHTYKEVTQLREFLLREEKY